LTKEDSRSNPRGSRGRTIVNRTLADVKTTTTRPRAKRAPLIGPWLAVQRIALAPLQYRR
jgi:hypothetical protein